MLDAKIPRGWYRVVALTYEVGAQGEEVLTLRHEMYGETSERAIAVYRAHLESDAFLRECSVNQVFETTRGAILCRTYTEVQGPF